MLSLLQSGRYETFALILVAIVLSLSFHEFGHAWSAKRLGDDTAERLGRLTINPIRHIEPIGLLMVVLVGFGWARPVPTDPRNFTHPLAGALVAVAGPAANLVIAVVATNVYALGVANGWGFAASPVAAEFFFLLVYINVLLMLFNLIPLGPLDGHYILPHLLATNVARAYVEFNARYGAVVLLGLVVLSYLGLPVFAWLRSAARWVIDLITVLG